jgi:hypothetical protein
LLDVRVRVDAAGSDNPAGCINFIDARTKLLSNRSNGLVSDADIHARNTLRENRSSAADDN